VGACQSAFDFVGEWQLRGEPGPIAVCQRIGQAGIDQNAWYSGRDMTFATTIPTPAGPSLSVQIDVGQALFLVGANGAGKSSLMHLFYGAHHAKSRRISAHRQTWFSSNSITLSPEQKRQTESNIKSTDTSPQARWKDDYSAHRASIAIYDLIDAENVRARSIAGAVDGDQMALAKELSRKDAPLKVINELLRLSNIPVEVSVHQNEQVLASRRGSPTYSVAELSDGERNALLIAANVLTVPPGTLLLIDEPERHLHRSIISPLLTLLFSKRQDCAFVVSTHDVMLPLDNPSAKTLLIRGCAYSGSSVSGWDVDFLESAEDVDESIKRDILGARRRVLFVEGDSQSLDAPLYALVFPNASVVPKTSCRDVIHAVTGVRAAASLHWVRAFGLIDNDRRSSPDVDQLREQGVHALPVFSVESIYYHPNLQALVAARHAAVTGSEATSLIAEASQRAIASLRPHARRLSERVVERHLRDELERHLPTSKDIAAGNPISVTIDVRAAVEIELATLNEFLDRGDLNSVVARYPIRETPALTEIAKRLGFQGRDQYESAVRKLLMDDTDALAFVRRLFGKLAGELSE
jgi:ABC-type Mn2+/Zn2+ transport system ATPase subunit